MNEVQILEKLIRSKEKALLRLQGELESLRAALAKLRPGA